MNKEELMHILPHRDDMMLVDEAYVENNIAYGKKKIVGDEYFLRGHFPGNPIVPGVILCEMMAQSACVLLPEVPDTVLRFLTGLDKVRFKRQVKPGDVFESQTEIVKNYKNFYWVKGKGFVDGELCMTAEFTFALADTAQ